MKGPIEPLLCAAATLKREIERLHRAVMARAQATPACRLLMSVPGVGPVTALAFVATPELDNRMLITGELFRWPEKKAAATA